jgi:hypothetical protein
MGKVAQLRDLREMATPGWERLHHAADRNRPALERHVAAAFAKALFRLGPLPSDEVALEVHMDELMQELERTLRYGLQELLLKTLYDGADAAAQSLMRSPMMRTSQGYYRPTLVLLRAAIAHRVPKESHV